MFGPSLAGGGVLTGRTSAKVEPKRISSKDRSLGIADGDLIKAGLVKVDIDGGKRGSQSRGGIADEIQIEGVVGAIGSPIDTTDDQVGSATDSDGAFLSDDAIVIEQRLAYACFQNQVPRRPRS